LRNRRSFHILDIQGVDPVHKGIRAQRKRDRAMTEADDETRTATNEMPV
jgi:hypothetical protein